MVIRNKHVTDERNSAIILKKYYSFNLKKQINFNVFVTEKDPRIPWELVAHPVGSAEHTLRTAAVADERKAENVFLCTM
jgi:hypothetical protein